MCDCSKLVTLSECQRLRKYNADPEKRFFIYHIFDDLRGLKIAYVPKDDNPNNVALKRGFVDDKGNPKWYNIKEHPCNII